MGYTFGERRGYSHMYASKKTSSSKRTQVLQHLLTNVITKNSRNTRRRRNKKSAKIRTLIQIHPSPAHTIDKEVLMQNKIFFLG
jgi:hypothetical protein